MAKTIWPWLLLASSSLASCKQHFFSSEGTQAGILRRFSLNGSLSAENILAASQDYNLDVWQITNSFSDIYFPSSSLALPSDLKGHAHTTTTVSYKIPDQRSSPSSWNLTSLENSTFHTDYHPISEIDQFIHELANLHPNMTNIVQLGHSSEGREMRALEISRGYAMVQTRRPMDPSRRLGFVIMGAQHAREWVSTSAALYIAHALVANSSSPHSLASLLDTFDFYIIPSPNPDGYSYTWQTDRFWYKNRQVLGPDVKCVGLDMNRNWGYKWKASAPDLVASEKKKKKKQPPANECSHWFPGHHAFESPEVNNIANYLTTLPNLVGFINLRAYGQMVSTPYSYSLKRIPKDGEDQTEAAMGAVHTIRQAHGAVFTTGRLSETLYPAPGNILDYAYARLGIKFSYTAHLRDTGTYGFNLPASWIRPVGEETGAMVRYLASFIKVNQKR